MIAPHEVWAEISATLRKRGFTEVQGAVPEFHGSMNVHGRQIDIALLIPDPTFVTLPTVRLLDPDQLPVQVYGHIARDGEDRSTACYAPAVGLPLDLHAPGGSVLRVLERAKNAIERNYAGRGLGEVVAEYQEYWTPKGKLFRIMVPKQAAKTVCASITYSVFKSAEGSPFYAVHEDTELHGHKGRKLCDSILLELGAELGPNEASFVPSTLPELQRWFEAQSGGVAKFWPECEQALLGRKFVALAATNCTLGVRLVVPPTIKVGIKQGKIRPEKIDWLLEKRKNSLEIRRYGGFRTDLASLAQRNLYGLNTLERISIVLVGCGTIGSHLAKFLVQSGAGGRNPLLMIDRDVLRSGNIGRHYLGHASIDTVKTEAMAEELKRFHPQADVRSCPGNALELKGQLAAADLIIDATGDWNTRYALNEWFRNLSGGPGAILYSWVSGNGAAAQSFLNLREDDCCLRCLHPKMSEPPRFRPLKPGVEANQAPATCGDGAYIPYSVAAPATAAGLACDMAIDWANDRPGPRLRTILLDPERGIRREPTSPTRHKDCPSCNRRQLS